MKKSILLLALLAGCASVQYREPPTDAQRQAVRNGMTAAEVEQALGGPPTGRTESYASGETVAGWKIDTHFQGIRNAYFNVHYRDGAVVRTSESFDYLSMP